jgi:hypothetical protein
MNYFNSQGRKYQVRVRLFNNDLTHNDVEVPMFSNSNLNDVRDIVEDFTEKLDCNPKKYGLDLNGPNNVTFQIVSMRDSKGRNWIEDSSVYGGIYLEELEAAE